MSAHNLISKNIIILFSATCREKVSEQIMDNYAHALCMCVCLCGWVGVGVGESEYWKLGILSRIGDNGLFITLVLKII